MKVFYFVSSKISCRYQISIFLFYEIMCKIKALDEEGMGHDDRRIGGGRNIDNMKPLFPFV